MPTLFHRCMTLFRRTCLASWATVSVPTRRHWRPVVAKLVFGTACSLLACVAQAERADKDKPLNVEADKLEYDDLKQLNVFTGNVVLTKGTMVIRAHRVEVRQDPEGYQFGTASALPGQLASYRQKREGVDQFMEGYGEQIEFNGKVDNVKFINRAYMKRLEKEKTTDEVRGRVIVYDNRTEFFGVEGSADNNSHSSSGRVRAVIQPKTSTTNNTENQQNTPLKAATQLNGKLPE